MGIFMENRLIYCLKYLLILLIIPFINSCSDDTESPVEPNFSTDGTKALLILVENSYLISPDLGAIYPTIKTTADSVLAQVFEIDKNQLADKSLNEIIETYGEDWQIKQIRSVADKYYDRVIVLTDQTANYNTLLDSLKYLNSNYSAVDMILNAHGGEESIVFGNYSVSSNELVNDLISKSINIRALYQTCCYGASTVDDFERGGVYCCNGSSGVNYLTMFSAKLWLEKWCSGSSYIQAVLFAYSQEIEEIKKYSGSLPLDDLFLNSENLNSSIQTVRGKFIKLLFNQIKQI